MHNDTIKVANKIISDGNLETIFQKMNEELQKLQKQYQIEIAQNERFERQYQNWTVRDFDGRFHFSIDFYDDTRISTESYGEFISLFNNRIREIKEIFLTYGYTYWEQSTGQNPVYHSPNIHISIRETKMDISVKLDGNKMDEVYKLIKDIILTAPEKYDRIIKRKSSISSKITFAIGVIPSMIILFLLVFVPTIRGIYANTYIGYTIGVLILGFGIGSFFGGKIEKLYENIMPEKKYAGFDKEKMKSIYTDDIDKYTETSEIIIGKNVDNLKNREEILNLEKKYSKFIPYELLAILVLSIIVFVVSVVFK